MTHSDREAIPMTVRRFRKKPVEIEAIQVTPHNCAAVADWVNGRPGAYKAGYAGKAYPDIGGVEIPTLEGVMRAAWGDWVIKGVQGEFYPCKPDIFAKTYNEVSVSETTK
ncbi:hypothetical protein [Nocardia sp. NPDC057455]|uniref:hypothetical protein n=1 Tax=Nocardia sp. NPDC057455 TaxID=3346138 RepID=UPI00366F2122